MEVESMKYMQYKQVMLTMSVLLCGLTAGYAYSVDVNEEFDIQLELIDSQERDIDPARVVGEALNRLLANEYALAVKTQNFHWNVTGINFVGLHKLFEEQYTQLQKFIDLIAERARALQVKAIGTFIEFKQMSDITESLEKQYTDIDMIKQLLHDHELVIQQLRSLVDFSANVNDMGSNNLLSNILELHEKMAWMLRAHIE